MIKIRNFVANNKKKILVSILIGIILSGLPFILYISSFQNPEVLDGIGIIHEFEGFPFGTIITLTVIKLNDATMKLLCDHDLGGEENIYTEEENNARIISSQSEEEILNPPFRVGETYYVCGNGIRSLTSYLLIGGLSAFINIFIVSFIFIYLLEKNFQKNKKNKK